MKRTRFLLLFSMLLSAAAVPHAQLRRETDEPGLRGYVLAPDGTPVSSGQVTAVRAVASRVTATIDRAGRFRLFPEAGPHQVVVAAPGFAPYRFNITVPASRTVNLPVIRLSPATYFRARFVTASGELLNSPAMLRRRSVDARGVQIPDPLEGQTTEQVDADGGITIGPLPWGVTMFAVDLLPFAQTRLPDVVVNGKDPLIDGGVITIQPGAVLQADIVDENGAPVAAHDVWIEETAPRSLLSFQPARTNSQGRASFDRLAPGRYRLWTKTKDFCGNQPLAIARIVLVGGDEIVHERVVIGGRATFRVVSPLGPMNGRIVRATPESNVSAPWQRARDLSGLERRPPLPVPLSPSCAGGTDADGRVTLTNFPPGPTDVAVRLFNSTYVRRVIVPESGREIPVQIPDGLISVRVTNQRSNEPVGHAQIVWTGNGGRVEAMATANGDALLEAVGAAGGQLAVTARNYQPLEASFPEPPATVQEVALPPEAATRVLARVVSAAGAALPNAVVELSPTDALDVSDIAVTDARGLATFLDAYRAGGREGGWVGPRAHRGRGGGRCSGPLSDRYTTASWSTASRKANSTSAQSSSRTLPKRSRSRAPSSLPATGRSTTTARGSHST